MRKKNIKKISNSFCLMLAAILSFSVPVAAADFGDTGDVEITKMKENVPIAELESLLSNSNANPKAGFNLASTLSTSERAADAYEPNDTKETAYNYDKIPTMNTNVLFSNGYKSANLHTVGDEDWYYTTLTAGKKYFLDLRNIGSTRGFNISLIHYNDDGTIDDIVSSINDTKFENRPEKYYVYTPSKSGKYYVRITGDGVNVSSMNYFFYIGEKERTFTYTAPVKAQIPVFGKTYQTGKQFDLTNAVPKNSVVLSMSFSNKFSGTKCTECQKKVVAADGKAYYSSASGGTEILNISEKQNLDQAWTISARCTSNMHFTNLSTTITARYRCEMQPYPGNEVY